MGFSVRVAGFSMLCFMSFASKPTAYRLVHAQSPTRSFLRIKLATSTRISPNFVYAILNPVNRVKGSGIGLAAKVTIFPPTTSPTKAKMVGRV